MNDTPTYGVYRGENSNYNNNNFNIRLLNHTQVDEEQIEEDKTESKEYKHGKCDLAGNKDFSDYNKSSERNDK